MYKTKSRKKLKEIAIRNKNHTKIRFAERYGVDFSNSDIDNICSLINRNMIMKTIKNTPHKKICIVNYNGNTFKVVYSIETKTLKTALDLHGNP